MLVRRASRPRPDCSLNFTAPYNQRLMRRFVYLLCSIWSRVYIKRSGVRPSLSVCPIDRQQQRHAVGLLLSAIRISDEKRWMRSLRVVQQLNRSLAGTGLSTAECTSCIIVLAPGVNCTQLCCRLISKFIDIKVIPVVTYVSCARRPAPLHTSSTNRLNQGKNRQVFETSRYPVRR